MLCYVPKIKCLILSPVNHNTFTVQLGTYCQTIINECTTQEAWVEREPRPASRNEHVYERTTSYNFDRADDNICSEHYCGPVPFSEEETKAFRNVADRHFYGYLSVHSAGTKVLFPLGTTHDEHNRHLAMTKQIALAMRKVDNSMFVNGNMQRMGKKSYGMAMDWMYFVKNIPHSYVIETRGQNGLDFIQPKHILLAAKEVNAGLMKFAEEFK